MKQIARFYTLFWIIYFPTCIAYNDLPGFSSIDEVLTGILVIFTFVQKGKSSVNAEPWREYMIFMYILLFYIVYSLIMQVNVMNAIWYDLIQQVRPWSVIYCTWILNPIFTKRQKRYMLWSMALTVISFLIYHPEMTDVAGEHRNAPFGQLSICSSMAWFLFSKPTKWNRYIATAIAVVGLLGMKFKYYGEFGAWMFMIYYMKKRFNLTSMRVYWQLGLLAFVVILLGWERFNEYYIEGVDNEQLARPMMNKTAWKIMWEYFPFGSGLGTFGTAAAGVYYSPLFAKYHLDGIWGLMNYHGVLAFHADSFLASFAQIGFFGTFFFILFWRNRFRNFNDIEDMRYYKVGMMAFFCMFIEWFGDSSFFSGKGMGYLMLMGLCLNSNRNMENQEEEEEEDEEEEGLSQPSPSPSPQPSP